MSCLQTNVFIYLSQYVLEPHLYDNISPGFNETKCERVETEHKRERFREDHERRESLMPPILLHKLVKLLSVLHCTFS